MSGRRAGSRRPSPRSARVAEAIREVVADELERRDDDRLGLLTITSVDVVTDLRSATIWFTTAREDAGKLRDPTEAEIDATRTALQQAVPHLLLALGEHLRLRYLPRLTFSLDDAPASGARVEEIIRGWQATDEGGADAQR
jgi:ribosome-binding factor A